MPRPYKGRQLELFLPPSLAEWIEGIARARESDTSDAVAAVITKARELKPPKVDARPRVRVRAKVSEELRAEIERWPGRSLSDRFRNLSATVREMDEFRG